MNKYRIYESNAKFVLTTKFFFFFFVEINNHLRAYISDFCLSLHTFSSSKSSARTSVTQGKRKQETKPVSILPVVCLAFGGQFLFAIFLKVLNDILIFASPELLK